MPIFVVVVKRGVDQAKRHIDALPHDSVYGLTDNAWLIHYKGTTRALAEHIKIRNESNITGIAFSIGNYSGRFSTDAWEWLKLHRKMETPDGSVNVLRQNDGVRDCNERSGSRSLVRYSAH